MPRRTSPTLADALDEYLNLRLATCARTTYDNDRSIVGAFVNSVGPSSRVHLVTPQACERYLLSIRAKQKPASFNKHKGRVATFLKFCQTRGWLDTDLLALIPDAKVPKVERLQLSPADLIDLPNHADNARDRAFIATACNTALRANEICSLRVKDVNLADGWLRAHVTKSATEGRLPISSDLDAELRKWLTEYTEDVGGSLNPEWFLFPAREPAKGRLRDGQGRMVGGYLMHSVGNYIPERPTKRAADIVQKALTSQGRVTFGKGEGVHTLRRSVARAFFDMRVAGGHDMALRETSALLFHATSDVTERYLGLTRERLGLDNALRGQAFLSAMVSKVNVTAIRPAAGDTSGTGLSDGPQETAS